MFLQLCVCPQGGLPQCMLGYTPCQGDPPAKETSCTPCQGYPLPGRTLLPERPPCQRDLPSCQGDPPARETSPTKETPLQAHNQGGNWGGSGPGPQPRGNWGGSAPGPHPRGKLRGIRSRPRPKVKLRGIRSRPTPKGEIQGDQIQAHTQGEIQGDQVHANIQVGNSGGSGPDPPRWLLLRAVRILLECILVLKIFWRKSGLFVGPLIFLFWTSGDVFLGFQSQGGFPCLHASLPVHKGFVRFTSGVTPAGLLMASVVSKLFWSTYLHSMIPIETRWYDVGQV